MVLVCIGIVGIVWGLGEVLWGNPALGLFAILGIATVCGAVYIYFRVARHPEPISPIQRSHGMTDVGRGRKPQSDMDAVRVLEILEVLEQADAPAWLDGGWAIDAALGRQTRAHDDLDLVVPLDKTGEAQNALRSLGYTKRRGSAPESFEMVDGEGHQVDVHPVRFTPTGEGRYRMASGVDWRYLPEAFVWTGGTVLGRPVRCLSPEAQMVSHTTGYALDAAHDADARALSEAFGIPLPEYERAEPSGPG